MGDAGDRAAPRSIGRYVLHGEIAAGGMATVHWGRLVGPSGFSRGVAIKRLHPQLARDPEFVAMFIDEARLAARIFHANVVPTLDVVAADGELFLVMEHVRGASLSRLLRGARDAGARIPPRIAANIAVGMLRGLHAAHEARGEDGRPLEIVHRDVSPQNVLVDVDGVARVLDFGIAKAATRVQSTRDGQLKGKLAYIAPERLRGEGASRSSDVYGASVVLWELLTCERLFKGDDDGDLVAKVIAGDVRPPSALAPDVPRALDGVVLRGLSGSPSARFTTARDMARAIEEALVPASQAEVSDWVMKHAAEDLSESAAQIAEIERSASEPSAVLGGRATAELPTLGASPVSRRASAERPAEGWRSTAWSTLLVGAALAVALGAGSAFVVTGSRPSPPAPAPARQGERAVRWSERATDEPVIVFDEVTAASASVAPPATVPPPASVAVLTAAPSRTAGAPPVGAPRTAAPKVALSPSASSSPSCDPPSITDERGHVHFKPECF
jgi:serine/threonine protein kinase